MIWIKQTFRKTVDKLASFSLPQKKPRESTNQQILATGGIPHGTETIAKKPGKASAESGDGAVSAAEVEEYISSISFPCQNINWSNMLTGRVHLRKSSILLQHR
jgi:hypothetical protein